MDLCETGDYQTGRTRVTSTRDSTCNLNYMLSEYLKHAQCMRHAQTEYESCVDVYQLRIKTLNKVTGTNHFINHSLIWDTL